MMQQDKLVDQQPSVADTIRRIERLNEDLRRFWSSSQGWAPDASAELMSRSRLDWQVSLSRSLRHWIVDPADSIGDGDLILGWVNLGSLIEGTIKLIMAVYYEDYKRDVETLKRTNAWHVTKQKLLEPDGLTLGVLIDYAEKAKLFPDHELALCRLVQERRNAIHAFKDRNIGTGSELYRAIKDYLAMLSSTAAGLPYPDTAYEPRDY